MALKIFTVNNKTGIHLKPATSIAQKALEFGDNEIMLKKEDQSANAKSVTDILSLGAGHLSEITLEVTGSEDESCLAEILSVIEAEDI